MSSLPISRGSIAAGGGIGLMGYDVFISYSSKDKAVADDVVAALEAAAPASVFQRPPEMD